MRPGLRAVMPVRRRDGYVSLWLDEALGAEQPASTATADPLLKADFVIVGGGFTGLWTAIRLLEHEPSATVCVLEAKYCGWGASGRNGGIAEPSWAKFPVMQRLFGSDEAVRLGHAFAAGLDDLESFCEEHAIDAEIRHRGVAWTATNEAQMGAWEGMHAALEGAGIGGVEVLGQAQASAAIGSRLALGGSFEAHAATLQPGRLVRGLRRVAIEAGAQIHEWTPMIGWRRDGATAVVETRTSEIRAGKVILAMNAWSASMPAVRPYVFVTSSDVIATATGAAPILGSAVAEGIACSDSRRLILYWRSTPDGRIVFGKGGGWMSIGNRVDGRFTGRSALAASVEARFRHLYPELREIAIEKSWNGPIDYSSTGLPYFGPLHDEDPDVLIGVGYSGMGVVQSVLGGRVLASLALGLDDQYASMPLTRRWPTRLPPDPLRSLGAPLVKYAVTRREQALDADARPGRLIDLLARLDPTASPNAS